MRDAVLHLGLYRAVCCFPEIEVVMGFQFVKNAEGLSYPNQKMGEEVVKSFNTWRFKRSHPSSLELLQEFVGRAVSAKNSIPFVLYWGKGLRVQSGVNERACLDYLLEMGQRIGNAYGAGAHFDILYTDTHANLNGHRACDIEEYMNNLKADCGNDFRVWKLSDVVAASKVNDSDVAVMPDEEVTEMVQRLVGCAEKWYRGGGQAADGAERYFWMNMVERIAVERTFSNSIFVTFNGSDMRPLFPLQLPIFYMYSVKKGTSVKPWFMDEPEGESAMVPQRRQAVRA